MNRRQFIKRYMKAGAAGLFLPQILVPQARAIHPAFFPRRQASAAAGACSTSDTVLLHDEMLFGWETGDDPTPWTGPDNVSDGDSATFTTNYDTSALTTGKPAGACNTGLRCVFTGANAFDVYRFSRGSAIAAGAANVDIRFYLYVQTILSGVGRTNIMVAGQNVDPSGGLSFVVEWRDDGGGVNEVRAGSVTDSAWIALTANSWNLIHVHIDTTNSSSTIAVNGGSAQGFTSSATAAIQYAYVGACFAGTGAAGALVYDLLAINTP